MFLSRYEQLPAVCLIEMMTMGGERRRGGREERGIGDTIPQDFEAGPVATLPPILLINNAAATGRYGLFTKQSSTILHK